jgi:hypothetical protein
MEQEKCNVALSSMSRYKCYITILKLMNLMYVLLEFVIYFIIIIFSGTLFILHKGQPFESGVMKSHWI